jgi:hypothetical protein
MSRFIVDWLAYGGSYRLGHRYAGSLERQYALVTSSKLGGRFMAPLPSAAWIET